MGEAYACAVACIVGLGLGLAFYGGLWLTLEGLERARRPVLRLIVSKLLRMGVTLAGFAWLLHSLDWYHLLLAMAAFSAPRVWLARRAEQRGGPN